MPAGLIDQEDGVGSGRDGCGDLGEVQVHRLGVAGRHDQGCTLALLRADCTEDVGGSGALVPRCAWTGAALGPAAGDLVLLADAGLVGKSAPERIPMALVEGGVEDEAERMRALAALSEVSYQIPLIRIRGPIGAVRWT